MDEDLQQTISTLAVFLGGLAAIFSGWCAFLSYRLSQKIRDELKSDERIISGAFIHPDLSVSAHAGCVLQCTLFNKSKRKAYVKSVKAFDQKEAEIDIAWSTEIDNLGNVMNPTQLIGIVDSSDLYIRANDAKEFDYLRVEIHHSSADSPLIAVFNFFEKWENK